MRFCKVVCCRACERYYHKCILGWGSGGGVRVTKYFILLSYYYFFFHRLSCVCLICRSIKRCCRYFKRCFFVENKVVEMFFWCWFLSSSHSGQSDVQGGATAAAGAASEVQHVAVKEPRRNYLEGIRPFISARDAVGPRKGKKETAEK